METPLTNRMLEMAIKIQQIPAPSFFESERAKFIRDQFIKESLEDIIIDDIGNVFGRLPGTGSISPIVISAHMDTVFPADTNLEIRQQADKIAGPGIGDNAIGLAGLFGLLWALNQRKKSLTNDLWLVANVGEEGLGDLRGMQAIVDRFGDKPKAYIVLEGMALGQIYHRGLDVQRYRIIVKTLGGHSWVNHGRPSAVHELAQIITRLLDLQIPEEPRTTLNVGVISGGMSVNAIAAEAHLDLDLRSEDPSALADLKTQVESTIQNSIYPGIRIEIESIGRRPVGEIPLDHPLVRLAMQSLESVGIQPRINIGSTDANIPLSRGYSAVCLGLTTGDGAHTINEYIHIPPLQQGLRQLLNVVDGLDRS